MCGLDELLVNLGATAIIYCVGFIINSCGLFEAIFYEAEFFDFIEISGFA